MNYETQVLGDSTIIMDGDDRRRSRKKLIIGAGIAVALVAAAVAISMRGGGDTAAAPAPGAVAPISRFSRSSASSPMPIARGSTHSRYPGCKTGWSG